MSPLARKLIGAHGIEKGARIHFGRDLEGNESGIFAFDNTGDDSTLCRWVAKMQ